MNFHRKASNQFTDVLRWDSFASLLVLSNEWVNNYGDLELVEMGRIDLDESKASYRVHRNNDDLRLWRTKKELPFAVIKEPKIITDQNILPVIKEIETQAKTFIAERTKVLQSANVRSPGLASLAAARNTVLLNKHK